MSFNISIATNTGSTVSKIAAVTSELAKAEAKAPAVGAAVERAMRDSSTSAERAARSIGSLGASFGSLGRAIHAEQFSVIAKSLDGLTAQFEREAAVLDRIRAPMREYQDELRAIDMLHRKGMITASEYAAEISRAGAPLVSKVNAPTGASAAGAPAASAAASGGLSLGSAAAAAGVSFGVKQAMDVMDDYTQINNRLRSLVDTSRNASGAQDRLSDSFDKVHAVANATRSELGTTAEAYVRISSATKSMGLSSDDALRVTGTLSKALKVGGASAAETSSAMLQLTQALASGVLAGDEFKSVSETSPYLMDLLSKSLGKTRGELKALSEQQKLTGKDIVDMALKSGAAVDAAFGKTKATFAEQLTVAKNEVVVFSGKVLPILERLSGKTLLDDVGQSMSAGANAGLAPYREIASTATSARDTVVSTMRTMAQSVGVDLGDAFGETTAKADMFKAQLSEIDKQKTAEKMAIEVHKLWNELNKVNDVLEAQKKGWGAAQDKVDSYAGAVAKFQEDRQHLVNALKEVGIDPSIEMGGKKDGVAKMLQPGRDETEAVRGHHKAQLDANEAMGRYGEVVVAAKKATYDHKNALDDVNGAYADNLLTMTEYSEALKALGVEESAASKMLKEIHAPQKAFREGVNAVNELLGTGLITTRQYREELDKLGAAYAGADLMKILNGALHPVAFKPNSQANEAAQAEAEAKHRVDMQIAAEKAQDDAYRKSAGVAGIGPDGPIDVQADGAYGKAKTAAYGRITNALAEYNQGLAIASQLQADNAITAAQYGREVDSITRAYMTASGEALTMEGGAKLALIDLRSQAEDAGTAIKDSLASAFKSIEDSFAHFIETGKFDFGSLVDSMLADMARLIAHQALGAVVNGIVGLVGLATGDGGGGAASSVGGLLGTVIAAAPAPELVSDTGYNPGSSQRHSSGQTVVHVHNHVDSEQLMGAMDSREGEKLVMNVIRRQSPALRSYTNRR